MSGSSVFYLFSDIWNLIWSWQVVVTTNLKFGDQMKWTIEKTKEKILLKSIPENSVKQCHSNNTHLSYYYVIQNKSQSKILWQAYVAISGNQHFVLFAKKMSIYLRWRGAINKNNLYQNSCEIAKTSLIVNVSYGSTLLYIQHNFELYVQSIYFFPLSLDVLLRNKKWHSGLRQKLPNGWWISRFSWGRLEILLVDGNCLKAAVLRDNYNVKIR